MYKNFGFFDVDCRELSPDGNNLIFRPRVKAIARKLDKLYNIILTSGVPLLSTTCCSGKMLNKDSIDDILFVPLDQDSSQWKEELHNYKHFYIQKKAYGNPKLNYSCKAYDTFSDNKNALELLKKLDITYWVVFGNGFDLCVNSVSHSILKAGYKVILISDLMIPAAKGYGNCGTEENKIAIFNKLSKMGAVKLTFNDFIDKYFDRNKTS